MEIKKTSDKARIPTKGSKFAAGYDLYSIDDPTMLQHSERKLFKTGIHIKIPTGYYGRIAPRSGLSLKQGLDVMAGVIDSDYIGEIGIILINFDNMPVTVDTSKPIAQLIIEKHFDVDLTEVGELNQTQRGTGGFGSTDQTDPSLESKLSLSEMYLQSGGISVRGKYTEEVKKREQI
jgi:dUTP pyrophosphatase